MTDEDTWQHDATELAFKNGYNKAIADSNFMLITVIDREILTETFPTYGAARTTMLEELCDCIRDKELINIETQEYETDWFGYSKWGAWCNSRNDYDWSIVHIIREEVE